jgi:lysozyme family protein
MPAFNQAFAIVIGHEGGFDATPADPGNWTGGAIGKGHNNGTNWGISAAAYPALAIATLTQDDAKAIYRSDYWDIVEGDTLPPPLALLVFDAAVNNGIGHAIRWLQSAVGTVPDGQLGPATQAAVTATSARIGGAALCAEFQAQRLAFMAGLPTWRVFGLGWSRRLCQLPYQSMTMGAPLTCCP